MAESGETVLCYLLRSGEDRLGYTAIPITDLQVFLAKVESVQELYDGTVGNRDGYGNPEAAEKMGRVYRTMLDQGIATRFETISDYSGGASATLQYRAYDPDRSYSGYDPRHYGYLSDPRISFAREKFSTTLAGMKLLEKIGKRMIAFDKKDLGHARDEVGDWCWENPLRVLSVLARMKAVRVERWEADSRAGHYAGMQIVNASRPRERLRNEGLLAIFHAG